MEKRIEEKRREERRRNRRKERPIDNSPLLPSLGPQFLLLSTPELIQHPTSLPVPHF